MDSTTAFSAMEDFIQQLDDAEAARRLAHALTQRKPFALFKYEVESGPYRLAWYKFRDEHYGNWLDQQIRMWSEHR
jgi:hypothetical protein